MKRSPVKQRRNSAPFDPHRAWTLALASLVISLATFLLYLPAVGHEFIQYDDPEYVTRNPAVFKGCSMEGILKAFAQSHASNWHPLTWISHMLDCQIYGLNPAGHHLTNILLHSFNAALLFWVLNRMTGTFWRSLAVAVLFAWHPLRVESVAWISERKDVLSGFFFLLTLLAYHHYVQKRRPEERPVPLADSRYLLAIFLFACGLMAKPMLVTLPCLLLLLDYWPLKRISIDDPRRMACLRGLVLEKIPFLLLSLASCAITFIVQRYSGATRMIANLDLWPRLQNTTVSYCRYIGKTFWPSDLSVFYPFPPDWWDPAVVASSALAILAASGLALAAAQRYPYIIVGWFWYLGALVPVIGLLQVGEQSMADRYTYIPSIGLLVVVVWTTGARIHYFRCPQWAVALGLLPLAVPCLALTRRQIGYWQDGERLFRHAKALTPPYYVARECLGDALIAKNKNKEALAEYDEALRLNDRSAQSYHNKGTALKALGRLEEARDCYEKAVHYDPRLNRSYLALARIHFKKGQYSESISFCQRGLVEDPDDPDLRFVLGCVLKAAGRYDECYAEWLRVLSENPDHAGAHAQLAILLAEAGRLGEPLPHFKEAVRLEPTNEDYRYNLNYTLSLAN